MTTIVIDRYTASQAEAASSCYEYVQLWGEDLLAYLTVDGFLRIKKVQDIITHTLVENVQWFSIVNYTPDIQGLRIFFAKRDGSWWVMFYKAIGDQNPTLIRLDALQEMPVSFSTGYLSPRWIILLDDGMHHKAYTALDEIFNQGLMSEVIYNNSFNTNLLVTFPRFSVSKLNSQTMTVAVNYSDSTSNTSGVATYAAKIPGFGV